MANSSNTDSFIITTLSASTTTHGSIQSPFGLRSTIRGSCFPRGSFSGHVAWSEPLHCIIPEVVEEVSEQRFDLPRIDPAGVGGGPAVIVYPPTIWTIPTCNIIVLASGDGSASQAMDNTLWQLQDQNSIAMTGEIIWQGPPALTCDGAYTEFPNSNTGTIFGWTQNMCTMKVQFNNLSSGEYRIVIVDDNFDVTDAWNMNVKITNVAETVVYYPLAICGDSGGDLFDHTGYAYSRPIDSDASSTSGFQYPCFTQLPLTGLATYLYHTFTLSCGGS